MALLPTPQGAKALNKTDIYSSLSVLSSGSKRKLDYVDLTTGDDDKENRPSFIARKNTNGSDLVNKTPPKSSKTSTKDNSTSTNDSKVLAIELDEYYAFRTHWSAQQIRAKITNLMKSGVMKVSDFQDKLGVSSVGYYRFMNQKGSEKGMQSDTYVAAHQFFDIMETEGLKMPRAKKAKTDNSEDLSKFNVDHISLDGEESEDVPIYDTCDDLRPKIRAHLRQPGMTNAAFCREIAKTFNDGRKIQSVQLNTFLGYKGALAGNTSATYYAAYVYLEKLRLKNGKPKSEKREELEDIWPRGITRETTNRGYIGTPDMVLYMNEYGQIRGY